MNLKNFLTIERGNNIMFLIILRTIVFLVPIAISSTHALAAEDVVVAKVKCTLVSDRDKGGGVWCYWI